MCLKSGTDNKKSKEEIVTAEMKAEHFHWSQNWAGPASQKKLQLSVYRKFITCHIYWNLQ